MLLIDGVKYELWTPPSEEEFEKVVKEHAAEIFGKDAKYFDLKHKLASRSGTGSIPDGYVITLGESPEVQIIELELASHSLQHIISQIVNIINGIENSTTQQKICNAIEDEINQDEFLALKMAKIIRPTSIHRFLSDSFSNTLSKINIIIDKTSPVLEEAINKIGNPPNIIEFQTFTREGAESVHAHLFEPLYKPTLKKIIMNEVVKEEIPRNQINEKRVTAKDLIDANILKVGQILYGWHHSTKYEGKVQNDGSIDLLQTGRKFPSLNAAVYHIKGPEDAWRWWFTTREDGSECVLNELRKEYRKTHTPNS